MCACVPANQSVSNSSYHYYFLHRSLLLAMGRQTPGDRCKVHLRYKQMFEKDLKEVMESECGNKPFGKALKYLSVAPDMAECGMLSDACKG